MTGFGFDREHLEEAGASRAGPRAAVTSGDNSKVLTARIARESHDMPQVVARVCDLRRAKSLRRLGLPTVPSVSWTTDQLLRGLIPAQSAWGRTASTGTLRLVEVMLPAEWAGRRLAEVVPAGTRIAAVTSGGAAEHRGARHRRPGGRLAPAPLTRGSEARCATASPTPASSPRCTAFTSRRWR